MWAEAYPLSLAVCQQNAVCTCSLSDIIGFKPLLQAKPDTFPEYKSSEHALFTTAQAAQISHVQTT